MTGISSAPREPYRPAGCGPLAGVTVIDLVSGSAGAYATRLFTWLGAEVIRIEPPAGDPLRHQAPAPPSADGPHGLRFEHFNLGTRSIALDLSVESDRAIVRSLARTADVLIENRPVGGLEAIGLGAAAMLADNPRLVYTSVTPFGQTGPRAGWQATDIVAYAVGGMMFMTGDPDGPPVRLGAHAADHLSGLYAVFATLAALNHVTTSGHGQHVDISAQEAVASTIVDAGSTYYQFNDGLNPRRVGTEHPMIVPSGAFPARDGWVQINGLEPHMFRAVINWVGETGIDVEMLLDPELDAPINRLPLRELVHLLVGEATSQHDKLEIYELMQARGVPCAPFSELGDLMANPQLTSRAFFDRVHSHVAGHDVRVPGAPFRLSRTALCAASPAPALDANRSAVLERAGESRRGKPAQRDRVQRHGRAWGTPRALTGIRVIDLSWALAGPWCGRILATEGAEVIRVESGRRLDGLRRMAPHPDRSGSFINANAGKLGLSLDLSRPRAVELLTRLAAQADVVLDNFRPGVMDRLGLGDTALRRVNPSIITCSMPAQGETGPHRDFVAYAPVLMALSGHNNLTGEAAERPTSVATGYIDQLAGVMAATAILGAVHHRDLTGEGQHIELSQLEAAVGMLDSAALEYDAQGAEPQRQGNRSGEAAPQGCYPCAGEDRWVVVSVVDGAQWAALCGVIGRPDLAGLTTADARRARHDELDEAISEWTALRDPQDAMTTLQVAGVPAGAVQTVQDMLEYDPHLAARGFYETIRHPVMGEVRLERGAAKLARTPGGLCGRGGPVLGEHNEEIIIDLIGVSREEFERLRDEGVIDAPTVAAAAKAP